MLSKPRCPGDDEVGRSVDKIGELRRPFEHGQGVSTRRIAALWRRSRRRVGRLGERDAQKTMNAPAISAVYADFVVAVRLVGTRDRNR
jgi:hypothetical protein